MAEHEYDTIEACLAANAGREDVQEFCERVMGEKARRTKPFAGYADFADCVAQNQDADDPEAYCAAIMEQAEGGKSGLDADGKALKQRLRDKFGVRDEDDLRLKMFCASIKRDEVDPYLFTAMISTAVVDEDREVLLPSGMDASRFKRSGVVFWNHDHDRPVAYGKGVTRSADGIMGKAAFMRKPTDWQGDWFPDFARSFVTQAEEHGLKVGVSVGFVPRESRPPTKRDREQFGETAERITSKWTLVEWSIAPIQTNHEAVVTAVGKGRLSATAAKALFGVEAAEAVPAGPVAEPQAPKRWILPERKRVVVIVPVSIDPPPPPPDLEKIVQRRLDKLRGRVYS